MKILLQALLFVPLLSLGQDGDIWHSFYDEETSLRGYKNTKDSIVLDAKYGLFTVANKFDKIIGVSEYNEEQDKYDSYYLLKDGTQFGRDSLFIVDFSFACESEGFIKFEDKKTGLVGLFNSQAEVVIPAEYNDVSAVRNGAFIGLKNAKKNYWDKDKHSGCNHWNWKGGDESLVDTTNTVLIKDSKFSRDLNFYTLRITEEPLSDSVRDNFIGENGKYYSFVNNEKEFKTFFNKLLDELSIQNLLNNSYDEIVFLDEYDWTSLPKDQYFGQYGKETLERINYLNDSNLNIDYTIEPEIFLSVPESLGYLREERENNCGVLDASKYPTVEVLVMFYNKKGKYKNHDSYIFIKTDTAYKLLSVTTKVE